MQPQLTIMNQELQLIRVLDVEPVNMQPQEQQEAEGENSNWVHSNILDLSNIYGATFVGCEKETQALLMRQDERKEAMKVQKDELRWVQKEDNRNNTPRSRGIDKNELKD
ncbi:hypothetical protein KY290_012136 [Solanum tuberosum]|uniref:Uncharacterized protein n=1 Tax=Solanum tuberosum TaxID=4113 RepID=A0ABQ7W2M9_SOLTU|nr:hypothetical protein KY290_012136 [Solanum tuberosum]